MVKPHLFLKKYVILKFKKKKEKERKKGREREGGREGKKERGKQRKGRKRRKKNLQANTIGKITEVCAFINQGYTHTYNPSTLEGRAKQITTSGV